MTRSQNGQGVNTYLLVLDHTRVVFFVQRSLFSSTQYNLEQKGTFTLYI